MKICFFTNTFLPHIGGAEISTHYLASSLSRMGDEVIVLAPKYRERDEIKPEYEVHRYKQPPQGPLFIPMLKLYLLLERTKNRFDIVHAFNVYPPGFCAVGLKKYMAAPIVITAIGADVQIERDLEYGMRRDSKVNTMVQEALQGADVITVKSQAMKAEIQKISPRALEIKVIPNGVELKEFEISETSPQEKPYIFSLGRFVKKKGFDILIRAFTKVLDRYPEIELIIAGDGLEKENYLNLVQYLGVQDKVKFVGVVRGENRIVLFKGCTVFVCPSRREPFGLVNLEAMAAGKPIVASRVDGIPEVVKNGINGLLFEPGNEQDLADKVIFLLDHPEFRKKISIRAREMAKDYDWDIIAKEYRKIYIEEIGKKQKAVG